MNASKFKAPLNSDSAELNSWPPTKNSLIASGDRLLEKIQLQKGVKLKKNFTKKYLDGNNCAFRKSAVWAEDQLGQKIRWGRKFSAHTLTVRCV